MKGTPRVINNDRSPWSPVETWMTDFQFPVFQLPGPRFKNRTEGGNPGTLSIDVIHTFCFQGGCTFSRVLVSLFKQFCPVTLFRLAFSPTRSFSTHPLSIFSGLSTHPADDLIENKKQVLARSMEWERVLFLVRNCDETFPSKTLNNQLSSLIIDSHLAHQVWYSFF